MIRFLHQLNDRLEYLREKEAADKESKKRSWPTLRMFVNNPSQTTAILDL